MKGSWIALAFVAAILAVALAPASAQDVPAGQKLFMDNNCNNCHSVDALTIAKKMASSKAADLSTIGSTRDAEWLTKYISKEADIEGKKHMATFKGKPEDLKVLVDWLASLKKK
jgi:mono/diheme cytochrome c family protein